MKKIITFALSALCALVTFSVNAQTIVQDSAQGGQMLYRTYAKAIVPDSTTVAVRQMWGFNNSFNPFAASSWDTIVNSSATADTLLLADTTQMANTGIYFVRWEIQKVGGVSNFSQAILPVTVVPVVILPTAELNTKTATTNGGIQTIDYHAGFAPATMKVLISLGDTSFSNPVSQNTVVNLTDSGTYTWVFGTGYPAGYKFSYKFIVSNPAGSDTTSKGWIQVLPTNSTWIGQVDSFGSTDNTITTRTQVICNGSQTLRTYIAYANQSPIDSFDQAVPGSGTAMAKYVTFTGLNANTGYDIWSKFVGTSTIGQKRLISTLPTIYTFNITTDSVKTVSGKVRVYGTVTVPSNQTAQVGSMRAAGSDLNFTNALDASPMATFNQGLHQYTYDFENVPQGIAFRYKVYGFSSEGSYVDGNSLLQTLVIVGDTTKPIVTLFDTVSVSSTSVEVVFTATDSVGVTNFVLSRNGTVVATVLGTQSSYMFTGLTANTTYTLGLQAKDDAGNYSTQSVLVVTTDATSTAGTQAILSSVPQVCFGGSGWSSLIISGTNFQQGATFEANYYDGQPNDMGTITYISSTQCQVRIWSAAHYPQVDFTITNPGATVSNTLSTSVKDCTTTGIDETTRAEGSLINAFPNPFNNVITIEVGKTTEYMIIDLLGSSVQVGSLEKGQTQISLQQLPAGTYILRTETGLSKKIVKL